MYLPFLLLLSVTLNATVVYAEDEESLAQQAEKAGKFREALTLYVAELQSVSTESDKDLVLREKIIGLVKKLKPAPALPEKAERHTLRGTLAAKGATDKDDFLYAADEFRAALKIAPWLGQVYFNLGFVLGKAGQYSEANKNLKLYLIAEPNAEDTKMVKDLITENEFLQEEGIRRAEKVKAEEELAKRRKLQDWIGTWSFASPGQRGEKCGVVAKTPGTFNGSFTITSVTDSGDTIATFYLDGDLSSTPTWTGKATETSLVLTPSGHTNKVNSASGRLELIRDQSGARAIFSRSVEYDQGSLFNSSCQQRYSYNGVVFHH